MQDNVNLGGVSPAEIEEFSREGISRSSGAHMPYRAVFLKSVSDLILRRNKVDEGDTFAFFLLSKRSRDFVTQCRDGVFPFLSLGKDSVSGKIWISSASLHDSRVVDVSVKSASEAFERIESDEAFSILPCAAVSWSGTEPHLNFFPDGICDPETAFSVDLNEFEISEDDIKEALDAFYDRRLKTPQLMIDGGGAKIWRDARAGISVPKPEGVIQGRLIDALSVRFARHNVRPEHKADGGRADLFIYYVPDEEGERVSPRNLWVLELKALRDKTSSGKTVSPSVINKAVIDGFSQALDYRNQIPTEKAALCCYDLRKEDVGDTTCFSSLAKKADENGVHLWRWFLYRSKPSQRKVATGASA